MKNETRLPGEVIQLINLHKPLRSIMNFIETPLILSYIESFGIGTFRIRRRWWRDIRP